VLPGAAIIHPQPAHLQALGGDNLAPARVAVADHLPPSVRVALLAVHFKVRAAPLPTGSRSCRAP
jgi:hypothetical protein